MYFKVTVEDHNHNGLIFKEGLNEDPLPWYTGRPCSPGGIYLCDVEDLAYWLDYRQNLMWVWDAIKPDDARIHYEQNKVKVDKVILQNCRKIKDFVKELWDTEEKQLNAIKKSAGVFKFLHNPSGAVQLAAVRGDHVNIKYIQHQSEAVQHAVFTSSFIPNAIISYIKNPTPKVQQLVVSTNGQFIAHFDEPCEEAQLMAICKNPLNIQYIKNPSRVVQMQVVKFDPSYIRFIANPCPDAQMIAVQNELRNVCEIDNPCDEVKRFLETGI